MPGRPGGADEFGSGLASGDFDRDGAADLAIGAPGRNRVSVLFGTGHGLSGGRRDATARVERTTATASSHTTWTRDGYDDLRRRRARGGPAARQRAPPPRRAGRA